MSEYHASRLLISDSNIEVLDLERDLEQLEKDLKLMQSSNEYVKIPYIVEAIDYCRSEIKKLSTPIQVSGS